MTVLREPPAGTVTLLFTDIEGSTTYWEQLGGAFQPVLEEHHRLLRQEIERWGGLEVKTEGDAFMIAFQRAADAVAWAVAVQARLAAATWPPAIGELRVRIGMHTGEPILSRDPHGLPDYLGPPVNRAARVAHAGHGGQILVSAATRELAVPALDGEFEFASLGIHRLRGLEEAEEVFEIRHPSLPRRRFPSIRTLDARRHNLPVELTSFVGREAERAALKALLVRSGSMGVWEYGRMGVESPDPHTPTPPHSHTPHKSGPRLVTVWGPGGMGKTRLALQVAAEVIEAFRDGVYFVELETARRPDEAVNQIAGALGLQPPAGRDPREELLRHLAGHQLLLVLDNLEQLEGADRLAAEIARAAPEVTLLVTTRSTLRVRGEQVFEVGGLAAPPAGAPIEAMAAYPAITLFVERARAAAPGWDLAPENAAAVAELCRRLEGHPLALELAAARVRGLTPAEILERLRDRFRILAARSADRPERQRTLRGAIEWSYNLLDEEEQAFFARLSIFRGGFWMEAVEAISDDPDALDLVLSLQDKSLVAARALHGRTRYLLLDSMREYAAEQLAAAGNDPELRRAHALYYCQQLEQCVAAERRENEPELLQCLAHDLDNCRAARDWALAHDAALSVWGGIAGSHILARRGLWPEARRWAEQAAATAAQSGAEALEAAAQAELGSILHDLGEKEAARAAVERSLGLSGDASAPVRASRLNLLGVVLRALDRDDEARARYEEARQLCEQAGDGVGAAMATHNLVHLELKHRNWSAAEASCRSLLALRRQLGDRRGVGETLINLGWALYEQEEPEKLAEAHRYYQEAIPLWEALGDDLHVAISHHNLGETLEKQAQLPAAEEELLHALHLFEALGSPYEEETRKVLARVRGRLGEAEPGGGE